jgi:hypothetical protein
VVNIKIMVFWDVPYGSLVNTDEHFGGSLCAEDGGRKSLLNFDSYIPHFMVSHLRRL